MIILPIPTSIMISSKFIALFALLQLSQGQETPIKDDSFFYGLSPPVYPAPIGVGHGEWAPAYEKAATFVGQLTLIEKVNLTGGIADPTNGCAGLIGGIPRLGFKGLCLQDSGNGVRGSDLTNGYASGISVAAR
jgi:beta-glucosidase